MSQQHTPGPWRVSDWKRSPIPIVASDGRMVADVRLQPDPVSVQGWPTEEANARLIAAAPELLEIAQHVEQGGMSYPQWLRQKAKTAIAKATAPAQAIPANAGGEK